MTLLRDDAYEEMAMAFQAVQVKALDDALRERGIKDASIRRQICGTFTFALGNFLDQYWLEADGERVYPLLCFSKTFCDVNVEPTDLGEVYLPSESWAWHEYAFGAVDSHFDGEAPEVVVGCVGDEEE